MKRVAHAAHATRYDNDGAGVHPYVMLLQNDGTKKFNPEHEHGVHKEHDSGELELGGCTLHVRNLATPSTLRVTYFNNRLTVRLDRTPQLISIILIAAAHRTSRSLTQRGFIPGRGVVGGQRLHALH